MSPPEIPVNLLNQLNSAKSIAILTGAGISAESGIPTFRESQTSSSTGTGPALWSQYKSEELATPQAFQANPKLVWEWYLWRRGLIANAAPNPGHLALAEFESYITQNGSSFTLITQNVDGLHQQAGSQNVIELHGNITREKCFDCEQPNTRFFEWNPNAEIPGCPHCGGLLRPDVVWFGEGLPPNAIQSAWEAAENCEIFFSIGTSTLVQPAASLPLFAHQNRAVVIEINPAPTPLTPQATYVLQGAAGEVLPRLLVRLQFPGN
jgi:NAD-dependent deacetylase